MQANDKVDIVFSFLATSIYRKWWWQNYKQDQSALRAQWIKVVGRFGAYEIRQGLKKWSVKHGESTPPTPNEFAKYIMPVHTPASINGLRQARQSLGITT